MVRQRRPDLFRGPPVSGAIGLDEQRVPVCERPSGHEGSRPAGNAGALFEHGQSPVRRRLIEVSASLICARTSSRCWRALTSSRTELMRLSRSSRARCSVLCTSTVSGKTWLADLNEAAQGRALAPLYRDHLHSIEGALA